MSQEGKLVQFFLMASSESGVVSIDFGYIFLEDVEPVQVLSLIKLGSSFFFPESKKIILSAAFGSKGQVQAGYCNDSQ